MKVASVLLLCCLAFVQSQNSVKPNKRKFTNAVREFSGDAYNILTQESGGEGSGTRSSKNLIFSPLSIYLTMGMLLAGSEGETTHQLRRAMNTPDADFTEKNVHNLMRKLYKNTKRRPSADIFRVANGLFLQEDYDIKPAYYTTLNTSYQVEVENMNFADSYGSAERINGWIANVTENRITDLIDPGSLSGLTRLVLTNAVYFKASWLFPFASSNHTTFVRSDGSQVNTRFIEVVGLFQSIREEGMEFVAIPYNSTRNKNYMVIGLPVEGQNMSRFLHRAKRNFGGLYLHNGWTFRNFRVVIPEFQISQEIDLKNALLIKQRVTRIFSQTDSGLGRISDEPLYVTDYRHKAFINVNQQGTEAAAATSIILAGRSGAGPVDFVADHTFFFGIYNAESLVYTFMGKIDDPTAES